MNCDICKPIPSCVPLNVPKPVIFVFTRISKTCFFGQKHIICEISFPDIHGSIVFNTSATSHF